MPKKGYKQTAVHRARLDKPRKKYRKRLGFRHEKIRFTLKDKPVIIELCADNMSVRVFLWDIFSVEVGIPRDELIRLVKRLRRQGLRSRRYYPRRKKFTPISPEQKMAEMAEQYKNRFEEKRKSKIRR